METIVVVNTRKGFKAKSSLYGVRKYQSPGPTVTITASTSIGNDYRVWGIWIDTPPGTYNGGGQWTTPATKSENHNSGDSMIYALPDTGPHKIYFTESSGSSVPYSGTIAIVGQLSTNFTGIYNGNNASLYWPGTSSGSGGGTSSSTNPSISAVSNASAVVRGSTFTYTGSGFTPNGKVERKRINYDGSISHDDFISADNSGNINDSFTAGDYSGEYDGTDTLTLTDITSGKQASLQYTLVSAPSSGGSGSGGSSGGSNGGTSTSPPTGVTFPTLTTTTILAIGGGVVGLIVVIALVTVLSRR